MTQAELRRAPDNADLKTLRDRFNIWITAANGDGAGRLWLVGSEDGVRKNIIGGATLATGEYRFQARSGGGNHGAFLKAATAAKAVPSVTNAVMLIQDTAVSLGSSEVLRIYSSGGTNFTQLSSDTLGGLFLSGTGASGGSASMTTLILSGSLGFTGTGNRIAGDFSNATVASRVLFQTSTANGVTRVGAIPLGSGTAGAFEAHNNATPASGTVGRLEANATDVRLESLALGGSALPLTFRTAGAEAARLDTSGNLGVGVTATAGSRLHVVGGYIRAGGGIINLGAQIETVVIPASLTVNTNNYAPAGGSAASIIQISSTGAINVTGLSISQSIAGHRITLYNGGGFTITLTHVDGASSVANQFVSDTGANFALPSGKSKNMFWNGTWWILEGY